MKSVRSRQKTKRCISAVCLASSQSLLVNLWWIQIQIQIQIQLHHYRTARVHGAPETRQNEEGHTTRTKTQFSPASNEEAKPLQKTSIESLWYHYVSGERKPAATSRAYYETRTRNRVKEASTKESSHAENMQKHKNSAHARKNRQNLQIYRFI